ncbi:hypothetical protein GCM10011329_18160 [Stakelama pacifica]|nr:hypothetical protein GCM10011329_18160 [Stakelama pacifica]
MRDMREFSGTPGKMLGAEVDAEQLDLLRNPETGKLPANTFRVARRKARTGPGRPPGAGNKKSEALAKLIVHKYGDPVEAMAAMYAMPLDQLVELLLIADGSGGREHELFEIARKTQALLDRALDGEAGPLSEKQIERLTELAAKMDGLTQSLKSKPGELALKAMIAQRDAAKEVAQYVHSKRPIAVDMTRRHDVILNIPGLTDVEHLAEMTESGELTEDDLARLEFADFSEVSDPDAKPADGDDDAG